VVVWSALFRKRATHQSTTLFGLMHLMATCCWVSPLPLYALYTGITSSLPLLRVANQLLPCNFHVMSTIAGAAVTCLDTSENIIVHKLQSDVLVYDCVWLDALDGHLLLGLAVTAAFPLHRHNCKRTFAMTSTHIYCCPVTRSLACLLLLVVVVWSL
jgi:hypothetical protein